ncbi:MAG: MgtC/SapB family protein [Acidobacteria bacterium]|nr:MgtC/SapB family protein [Acidobacteriota bacterium]
MHFSFDWLQGWEDVLKLAIAYFLALPVGWHREKEAHSVGVRTFPVVAMAACGYVLLGAPGVSMTKEAESRIIQGVVAGIGFIGGGAILKSESHVHGTATAASIWCTGVVGASVAENRYLLAITLAGLNLFALRVLMPIKKRLDEEAELRQKLEQ